MRVTTIRITTRLLCRLAAVSLVVVAPLCGAARADDTLVVLPGDLTLYGPQARQRLVVERLLDTIPAGQVADAVKFTSSDEKVARIEGSEVFPIGNGEATITATVGQQQSTARVKVVDFDKPFAWSFRNHVVPVLSKAGCNSGGCHGALAGKNGFKLTLFGYDGQADWEYITRHARGRRINAADPGRSLLLLKPTGAVPHKGGVRLTTDSPEYRVLAEWIAAGAPPPREDDRRVERIELLPAGATIAPDGRQQMLVVAHYNDGTSADVTRLAKYTSTSDAVATVDDAGLVTIAGQGEAAIRAWFHNLNVVAPIQVPYANQLDAEVFAKAPRRNFIDERSLEKLQALNLPPAPRCSDAEFIRRAFLDTIGVLPTADETRQFLADTSADRRDKLIDALLARPEFVDYWAYKWSDLLLVSSERLKPPAMKAYYGWIRQQVEVNTPWDRFARELLTARGSTLANGAANFYALHDDPTEMAETASQAFMGLAIGCAKCHNHPLEKWTNDQYFGLANLFARVRTKNSDGEGNLVVFPAVTGELVQPNSGRPQPPRPLDAEPIDFDWTGDRREVFARWLTSPENPGFTRAIVNRVWANYLGVGLVEAVDDLRLTNPPSNARLLEELSAYLVGQKYDLKALMRLILQSETYQRSSTPLPGAEVDGRFYSHYYPRRLMAEVLLDAYSQATGTPTEFKDYPKGTRAMQLPDANVQSYFLQTFGRPDRLITCECERSATPSVVQVMHITNGDTLNGKLAAKDNAIDKLLAAGGPDYKLIEEVYVAALSRYPSDMELREILEVFAQTDSKDKRPLVEDLLWGLLSSREFLFNH